MDSAGQAAERTIQAAIGGEDGVGRGWIDLEARARADANVGGDIERGDGIAGRNRDARARHDCAGATQHRAIELTAKHPMTRCVPLETVVAPVKPVPVRIVVPA